MGLGGGRGLDCTGLEWTGLDWTGLGEDRLNTATKFRVP